MFAAFETLLSRRNPRFVCEDTGWPKPGPVKHVAYIRHEVGPALSADAMAHLESRVGDMPELLAFYRRYGSARLYCDTIEHPVVGFASAFWIAPPSEWEDLWDGFSGWLDNLSEDEKEEFLPEWIDDCAVIGEVPNSGNYFLVPLSGPDRGKVFEFEHDGFEFIEEGANLEAFLEAKSTVDEALLTEILSHTRYCDGKTSVQWLCREYAFDE